MPCPSRTSSLPDFGVSGCKPTARLFSSLATAAATVAAAAGHVASLRPCIFLHCSRLRVLSALSPLAVTVSLSVYAHVQGG